MLYFQTLTDVFSALRRRWLVVALVALAGCVVSIVYALNQPRVFQAIAVVQIENAQVSPGTEAESRDSLDARRTVRLIEQRVMARDNLLKIMDKYNLFTKNPKATLSDRVNEMRLAVRIDEILAGESWQSDTKASGLIITATLDDAQTAAAVANDILDQVMQEARQRSVERAKAELEFFNAEVARQQDEVRKLDAALTAFKTANAKYLPSGLTSLRTELTTLQTTELQLRQQLLALEADTSRARPETLKKRETVLRDQIALVVARVAEINAILDQAPEVELRLAAMTRELQQANAEYAVVARRKAEAELNQSLEEQSQSQRFEVLERAIVPDYPVSRSRKQVAAMGGAASLFLAIGIAFLIEFMNPAIRNSAQMERVLGVRPVVAIPDVTTMPKPKPRARGGKWKYAAGLVAALLVAGVAAASKFLIERGGSIGLVRDKVAGA